MGIWTSLSAMVCRPRADQVPGWLGDRGRGGQQPRRGLPRLAHDGPGRLVEVIPSTLTRTARPAGALTAEGALSAAVVRAAVVDGGNHQRVAREKSTPQSRHRHHCRRPRMPRRVPMPPHMGQVAQGSDMERGSVVQTVIRAFFTVSLRVVETAGPSMLAEALRRLGACPAPASALDGQPTVVRLRLGRGRPAPARDADLSIGDRVTLVNVVLARRGPQKRVAEDPPQTATATRRRHRGGQTLRPSISR